MVGEGYIQCNDLWRWSAIARLGDSQLKTGSHTIDFPVFGLSDVEP